MRVFLDTNVWFSALATHGLCESLLQRLVERDDIVSCDLVWNELSALLVRKLHFNAEEVELTRSLFDEVEMVPDFPDPADDADRRLIAAALAAGAELFVTGDKRVLEWQTSGSMRIVTPRLAWIILFAPHLAH